MKTKYFTLLSSAIAIFTTAAFAEMDLPVNLDFQDDALALTSFKGKHKCVVSYSTERASEGDSSLRLEIPPLDQDSGVALNFGMCDWTGYAALLADVFLEGEDSIEVMTSITTDEDNRYYQGVILDPGWNEAVRIFNLLEGNRGKQMAAVKEVYFYSLNKAASPQILFLDNLRLLERK
jgi:hypothetical protein